MLEDMLENERVSPAEAATAMLSFMQSELPTGGTAAENRFIKLFGPLCDRMFGKILDAKHDYRHKEGSWFSQSNRWTNAAGSPSALASRDVLKNSTHISSNSSAEDPVLKLIVPAGKRKIGSHQPLTLIDALTKESESRTLLYFKFPFLALPKTIQETYLSLIDFARIGPPTGNHVYFSENQGYLMGNLLRKSPMEQTDLQRYRAQTLSKKQPQPTINLNPLLGSPISPRSFSPSKEKVEEDSEPYIFLNMLEYFLFTLMRYPLLVQTPKQPDVRPPSAYTIGRREPYGEIIYVEVFRRLMVYFLPYECEGGRHVSFLQGSNQSLGARQSELFLRITIALWIETQMNVDQTSSVMQLMEDRRTRGKSQDYFFDLSCSYDFVQGTYCPPTSILQKCFRLIIAHLISDPSLKDSISTLNADSWCLGTSLTLIQVHFFNLMRITFRNASIHSSTSPFYTMFDAWLYWLEPWNTSPNSTKDFSPGTLKQNVMSSPKELVSRSSQMLHKHGGSKQYTSAWGSYVAANLYIYVVPLAIFLRRARELDFSPSSFDKSVRIVERAFRVFTPDLIDSISKMLKGQSCWSRIVDQHRENLGVFAPPFAGSMSLSALRHDMQSLLEEVQAQYQKTVREMDGISRLMAKVEGYFGQGVVSREEKALENLTKAARTIAELPLDWSIASPKASLLGSDIPCVNPLDYNNPERQKTGELTFRGRQQLLRGLVKSNPAITPHQRDRMRMRVMTYEIAMLVSLTVWISDIVNERFGFPVKSGLYGSFRVNLRFLADYRNLLSILLFTYVVIWII